MRRIKSFSVARPSHPHFPRAGETTFASDSGIPTFQHPLNNYARHTWGSDRLSDVGPGRPGWSPTQAPLRSGLAHHAHPVPHLMNSRPARSVVVTWTWFRSRCTCQVSLQRLMRRHPLPSTGSLGLVPPLQRYYEVLRLPAAHFAALRFLRLAIPSLRPLFVPPGPGRGAVDQSGVGGRYLRPPCSMETTGSPKFPEEPL